MKSTDQFKNDIRGLYQKLNEIAEEALEHFVKHPKGLSSRLMAELNKCTSSVSKILAENPEIIIKITREGEIDKLREILKLEKRLLKHSLFAHEGKEVPTHELRAVPTCSQYLIFLGADVFTKDGLPSKCPTCDGPLLPKTEEALDQYIEKERVMGMKEIDLLLAEELENGDPYLGMSPELRAMYQQLNNSLLITKSKLESMKEGGPEKLSSSLLKKCVSFLSTASKMAVRLEGMLESGIFDRHEEEEATECPEKPTTVKKKPKKKPTTTKKQKRADYSKVISRTALNPPDMGEMGVLLK